MITSFTQKPQNNKKSINLKKSDSKSREFVKIFFGEVGLTNATEKEILEYIVENLPKQQEPYYIVTPNPEILLYANAHPEFKKILNNAKIALTDGMQLFRAARLLGKPVKERIIGTDFVENLCKIVADRPITVGFLGAGPKIAEEVSECLRKKYPGLKVVFAGAEWNESLQDPVSSHPRLTSSLSQSLAGAHQGTSKHVTPSLAIDILFVAFGFPKQEQWMAEHVGKIPVKVMIGVGGAFDQIVHPSLRPPRVVHQAGFGWLYRLVREPRRIRRQMKLVQFVRLVLQEKLHATKQ